MTLPFLRRRRPVDPETLAAIVDGRPIAVALRRHVQARRLKLTLDSTGGRFVLTVPDRVPIEAAQRFLDSHAAWMADRLAHFIVARPFADGAELPLRGVAHRIRHCPDRRGTVWIDTSPATPLICVAGEAPHLKRRVTDFLRKSARADLAAAVSRHADRLAVSPSAIRLKDPKSRWGSCSAEGVLNFSWRLVLAPAVVLDYVAAHEVAHLVEMNHSDRFWAVVDGLVADSETPRNWLRRHGEALHGYGREPAE